MVDIMKRLLLVITTIIFMVAILCGCNHENKNQEPTTATQESQIDSTVSQVTQSDDQKSDENNLPDETHEAVIDFSEFE